MKKFLLLILLLVIVMVAGVSLVAADSENSALIIKIDENVCTWFIDDYFAVGTVHYVETSNGKWKLTCNGEIVDGPEPLTSALQLKSTDADPIITCETPFGTSNKVHVVFAPSGESTFTCQGDLTP